MRGSAPSGAQFMIGCEGVAATIVEVGGGLRTLTVGGRAVVDGYGEDERCSGARGQPLIPWPNRLDHGRYRWEGEDHQAPLTEPASQNAIHGMVRFAPWTRSASRTDRIEMSHVLWPRPGYPFAIALTIEYVLDEAGLEVRTTAHNIGDQPAPYGMGHHPYLRPTSGATINGCRLTLDAETYLPTDDRGLPTGQCPVDGSEYDFRAGPPIGEIQLDTTFTDLGRDGDARAWVHLSEGDTVVSLWLDQAYRYLEVFTGDSLPEPGRRRRGLGVEPMTCPPNAFASGTDVQALHPGDSFSAAWGITWANIPPPTNPAIA